MSSSLSEFKKSPLKISLEIFEHLPMDAKLDALLLKKMGRLEISDQTPTKEGKS